MLKWFLHVRRIGEGRESKHVFKMQVHGKLDMVGPEFLGRIGLKSWEIREARKWGATRGLCIDLMQNENIYKLRLIISMFISLT